MRSGKHTVLGGGLAAVVIVGALLLVFGTQSDSRVERVKDAITWDASCADVITSDTTDKDDWTSAAKTAVVECTHLGPLVKYARFADGPALRDDLLEHPPSAPTCIAGREVLVDYLDPGQFAPLCRQLDGDLIDAVSTLPDLPWDGTIEGTDRMVEAEQRRDTVAQGRALRRYLR